MIFRVTSGKAKGRELGAGMPFPAASRIAVLPIVSIIHACIQFDCFCLLEDTVRNLKFCLQAYRCKTPNSFLISVACAPSVSSDGDILDTLYFFPISFPFPQVSGSHASTDALSMPCCCGPSVRLPHNQGVEWFRAGGFGDGPSFFRASVLVL